MKYLLNTHVFLWWITNSPRLPKSVRIIFKEKRNELFFSTASIWEVMIKSQLKKIKLPDKPKEFIKEQLALNSIKILNVSLDHALEIYDLPKIHKDPFDRMLIAQVKVNRLPIITADSFIKQYNIDTFW